MSSTIKQRMADYVDQRPPEVIIQPAENVDLASVETGIDAGLVNLVDEVNDARGEYRTCRDDAHALSEIAVSLEEFSLLAMESIGCETGLEAQTLMAIQYGVNQHLKRVGTSLEFKSLESETMGNLEKTVLSVEGLGDALGKIWTGIVNVAKRAATAVFAFLGNVKAMVAKTKDKAKTLKSQLMSIDEKATGNIKSDAAKGLFYGDKTYRQLDSILGGFFETSGKYIDSFVQSAVKESRSIVHDLTTFGADGMPKINPETVEKYITDEEKRRDAFLSLGYGGRPRSSELSTDHANLRVDYSAGLPGGYRFVSNQPIITNDSPTGDALLVISEATFELEADKASGAPAELPVLSVKAAIAHCDRILDFCDNYGKAVDTSLDAGDAWWKLEDDNYMDKIEKAFDQIRVLSESETKKLMAEPSVKEAFSRGAKVGLKVVTGLAAVDGLVALGITGNLGVAIMATAVGFSAYVIPYALIGGVLGILFKSMMTAGGKESKLYFKSTDPNAPLLALMRGLATCRSWLGMYTVDTIYAVGSYYGKMAPSLIEYVSDSAKAHLAAAKATGAEPEAA